MIDPLSEQRVVEIRILIGTEMTDDELDKFCDDVETEVKEHLIDGEGVLGSFYTDKISYEGQQLLKEKGK